MSDLDSQLNAKDDFAFLGLAPAFPLSPVNLDSAVARTTNLIGLVSDPTQANALRQRLSVAKARLADPSQRARCLLTLLSGEAGPTAGEVPDSITAFESRAASASSDPSASAALKTEILHERQARLDHIAEVFSFPRNLPNRVAQTSRDTAIWNDLRVIDALDGILGRLS